jgi:hypothetical protein
VSPEVIGPIAAVLGAILGALLTGVIKARERRTELINKWLGHKRRLAKGFMQHIAVHCHGAKASDEDVSLIAQYYELGLAVSDDEAAAALYEALPERIKARVLHPAAQPFDRLREEGTSARKKPRVRPVPPDPPPPSP